MNANRQTRYFIVGCFALLILIGYSFPAGSLKNTREIHHILKLFLSDPCLHVSGFALFAMVLGWGLKKENEGRFPYFKVGSFCISYSVFLESLQVFLPKRGFEIVDLGCNCIGIGMGLLVLFIIEERNRKLT